MTQPAKQLSPCSSNDTNAQLQSYRKDIDRLDAEIAQLLEKRFELCCHIGDLKRDAEMSVEDQRREIVVLTRVAEATSNDRVREAVLDVYRVILKESRHLQE